MTTMRPLIGQQNPKRRRKLGIHHPIGSLDELQYRPSNRKISGIDFCSAKKAQLMFNSLTELRQNYDARQAASRAKEMQFQEEITPLFSAHDGTVRDSPGHRYDGNTSERSRRSIDGMKERKRRKSSRLDHLHISVEESETGDEKGALDAWEQRQDLTEAYRRLMMDIQRESNETNTITPTHTGGGRP